MNGTQIKCFLVMTVLAVIGFGPLSLTCLIGMYVVVARPGWFRSVVVNLYGDPAGDPIDDSARQPKKTSGTTRVRLKCFLWLLLLLVLDIAPVPVTGSIGLYVIIIRPYWFKALVEKLYCGIR